MTNPDFIHAKISVGEVDALLAEIERLRGIALPLATLFHDIWNAGYDSPTHVYDHMKSVGLLEAMRVRPDGGYKITDMGRSAIEIVNAARQTLDSEPAWNGT